MMKMMQVMIKMVMESSFEYICELPPVHHSSSCFCIPSPRPHDNSSHCIALHCIALLCIALHILIMMMIIIITRPWSTKAGDDDPDGDANDDNDDDCGDDDDDGDDAFINGTISLQ